MSTGARLKETIETYNKSAVQYQEKFMDWKTGIRKKFILRFNKLF